MVQHHLHRSGSPLTSPELLQSANLSLPSSKTNYLLLVLSPLPWDKFLLLQASFRSEISGADPTCSVHQQAGLQSGVGTWSHGCADPWNHTYLETLFFFLLSFSLIWSQWIHWSIAGATPRSERLQHCWRVIQVPPWGTCIISILLHIFNITFIYFKKALIRFSYINITYKAAQTVPLASWLWTFCVLFKACFRGSNILQFQPFKIEEQESAFFVIMTAVASVYLVNRPLLSQGFEQIPQVGFLMLSNCLQDSKWKLGINECFNFSVPKSEVVVSWGDNTSKHCIQCILLSLSTKLPCQEEGSSIFQICAVSYWLLRKQLGKKNLCCSFCVMCCFWIACRL